ncbi:MAG: 4-hydroxy-3-methylbut-2-enyl diphosphate reductase [Desulfovibrionaceae bacterium]
MKVLRAETAGFCMGVALALHKLDTLIAAKAGPPIFTLGPIIHNPQVLEDYEAQSVRIASDPSEIPPGSSVVIRAHGIPREVETRLRKRDVAIVDATCPRVKRAQVLIAEQSGMGRSLLLFGEEDHPEVKGLLSYAGPDGFVCHNLEQLKTHPLDKDTPYFLAAQTTQDRLAFEELVDHLLDRLGAGTPVLETICDATRDRQREALAVAGQVEAMVVVGGFSSGNTRRLVDVAQGCGIYCVHVETVAQLPLDALHRFATVGLTAGASTPQHIIDAVQQTLEAL